MYDIRHFHNVLWALLLLGFTGYAVAAETPGLWVLAVSGTLLNRWLVRRDSFRPLPRLAANLITLVFAVWMVLRVRAIPGPPIFAIGEFLTFLQLVKLYEQRGNRDYAQLLILSLLLMVAAAISTASLVFGVIFVAYLFLSLYSCLLFHLKAESDHARAMLQADDLPLNPAALKQSQRYIARSMRRLTMTVSGVSLLVGLIVFLFFPRGTGAGLIGNLAFKPGDTMTGFNDKVDFQEVAKISQNDSQVAYVTVHKNAEPWGGPGMPLILRGSALDTYVSDPKSSDRWQWKRTTDQLDIVPSITGGSTEQLAEVVPSGDLFTQDIRLLPTGTSTLFAMPGLISFKPSRDVIRLTHGKNDDVIQLPEQLTSEFNYTVVSTNEPPIPTTQPSQRPLSDFLNRMATPPSDAPQTYPVPAEIKSFAMRDAVAGVDANGNLAKQRLAKRSISALDEQIADNFEKYLQRNFSYTLDLTDARRVADQDPLVQFLYDFKRGHCEYFAGAMALMCQSLGMEARVVVGFKCYEYNNVGGYYVVRQSNAHAWVEVLTLNGWQSFDPTSSNDASANAHKTSLWQQVRYLMNFLEYKWGNAVVNYDSDSRTNLIQNVDSSLQNTAVTTSSWMQLVRDWFNAQNFWFVSSGLLSGLVGLAVFTSIIAVLLFLLERIRLRRRARRIGLNALPSTDQRRLARQLMFYDELLRSLGRREIVRKPHLTPLEFSRSVGFLPSDVYHDIQRMTRVFYRVRYGGMELQSAQQRRLLRVVERIDLMLNPSQH